jgi:polysaccharide export outer membrane protein
LLGRKAGLASTLKQGSLVRFCALPLCLLLLACAPGRGLPDLPQAASGPYSLGPGDVVRLITYGEEQLTGEFRVNDSGQIALPLVGPVQAVGLTPVALAARVSEALRRNDILRNPSVSAEVLTYRPVFVLGEVNKPGEYPYQPGMTVVQAAAVAGGFTYRAVQDYASIVRTRNGSATEGKASRQAFVLPGDVITVLERRF